MYNVVWPRGRGTEGKGRFAERLDSLDGKKIGFLYNFDGQNDILQAIERALAERYPKSQFFGSELFGTLHGGNEKEAIEALPGKLKELGVDAVVAGIAL